MTGHAPSDNHAALRGLLARYFAGIDDHTLDRDTLEAVFTDTAQLVRPNGSVMNGTTEILAGQTRSFARFRATHHVSSDHLIDIDQGTGSAGCTASIRANLIATHLWAYSNAHPEGMDLNTLDHYVTAGGVLHARARHTEAGWRLHHLELRNTWRTGTGFNAMAHTGTA